MCKTILKNNRGKYTITLMGKTHELPYGNVSDLLFKLPFDQHSSFLKIGSVIIEEKVFIINNEFVYEDSAEFRAAYN